MKEKKHTFSTDQVDQHRNVIRSKLEKATGVSDTCIEKYLFLFGNPDIKNDRILDIGSGEQEIFSRQAQKLYNAKVISVNPKLVDKEIRYKVQNNVVEKVVWGGWTGISIAARAQVLPIKDKIFDKVFAMQSITKYVPKREKEMAIREAMRVLKPGGSLYLYPVDVRQDVYVNLFNDLKKEGVEIVVYTYTNEYLCGVAIIKSDHANSK